MQPLFTIKEVISQAWKKTIDHAWFFIALTIATFAVTAFLGGVNDNSAASFLASIVSLVWCYFAAFTIARMSLKALRGEKLDANGIFEFNWGTFGFFILASLVVSIISTIGFILLIIPGIFLAVRLSLFNFVAVDGTSDPIEIVKKAFAMTRGYFWRLVGLSLVLGLINIAGAIALGVGLLITIPLTFLATAAAYEKLSKHHHAHKTHPDASGPVPVEEKIESKTEEKAA